MDRDNEDGRKFVISLTLSVISILVSILTLLLTSPVIIDRYLSPKVEYEAPRSWNHNQPVELRIANVGRAPVKEVNIELVLDFIPPGSGDQTGGFPLQLKDIATFPLKELDVVPFSDRDWVIRMISPVLPGEQVRLRVEFTSSLPTHPSPFPPRPIGISWLRVVYDGRVAIRR